MKDRSMRLRSIFPALLGLLAALHVWLAASVSEKLGVTCDEIAHLAAGHSYWLEKDYRLQPENGLLPQTLAAFPNVISKEVLFPDVHNDPQISKKWSQGIVWSVGASYFYNSGNDLPSLLNRARWMIAILGGCGVFLIGLWARGLGGDTGGLLAAGLASLSPTLLAHAGLATSDTAAAVGFVAATLCWWRLLHRLTPARLALAGISGGLLALAKFSGVIFAPVAALLLGIVMLSGRSLVVARWPGLRARRLTRSHRQLALLAAATGAALIAITTLWAGYGFRYSAVGPNAPVHSGFDRSWDSVLPATPYQSDFELADETLIANAYIRPKTLHKVVRFARDHQLLPEAWLYGLAYVDLHAQSRPAYLAGEWRFTGWKTFFPLAALLKSTPAELVLALLTAAGWFSLLIQPGHRNKQSAYRALPITVAIGTLAVFSISSSLNIGHRHLLPIYALTFVLAGLLPGLLARRLHGKLNLAFLSALLLVQAHAALSVRPNYLTYFNFIAGGPSNGYRFLVDSSLDWGQGFPALKNWLETEAPPHERVFLSYFGSDIPERLGIKAFRFGDNYFRINDNNFYIHPLEPGLYVISATMWQRVYTHVRGPWSESFEAAYWRHFDFWRSVPPSRKNGVTRDELSPEDGYKQLIYFDHLRLGKLIASLQSRQPIALVANHLLVFQLTQEDLTQLMLRPTPGFSPPEFSP